MVKSKTGLWKEDGNDGEFYFQGRSRQLYPVRRKNIDLLLYDLYYFELLPAFKKIFTDAETNLPCPTIIEQYPRDFAFVGTSGDLKKIFVNQGYFRTRGGKVVLDQISLIPHEVLASDLFFKEVPDFMKDLKRFNNSSATLQKTIIRFSHTPQDNPYSEGKLVYESKIILALHAFLFAIILIPLETFIIGSTITILNSIKSKYKTYSNRSPMVDFTGKARWQYLHTLMPPTIPSVEEIKLLIDGHEPNREALLHFFVKHTVENSSQYKTLSDIRKAIGILDQVKESFPKTKVFPIFYDSEGQSKEIQTTVGARLWFSLANEKGADEALKYLLNYNQYGKNTPYFDLNTLLDRLNAPATKKHMASLL